MFHTWNSKIPENVIILFIFNFYTVFPEINYITVAILVIDFDLRFTLLAFGHQGVVVGVYMSGF